MCIGYYILLRSVGCGIRSSSSGRACCVTLLLCYHEIIHVASLLMLYLRLLLLLRAGWVWGLVLPLLEKSSWQLSWDNFRATVGALRFSCLDSNRTVLNLLMLLRICHIRVHANLLLNCLGIVKDLLAVAVVRAWGVTTWVHQLLAMEELGVKEWVLATCYCCTLKMGHTTLILALLLCIHGNIARRINRLGHIAWLRAAFHCKSVDDYVDVAAQTPAITSGTMGAWFLG